MTDELRESLEMLPNLCPAEPSAANWVGPTTIGDGHGGVWAWMPASPWQWLAKVIGWGGLEIPVRAPDCWTSPWPWAPRQYRDAHRRIEMMIAAAVDPPHPGHDGGPR